MGEKRGMKALEAWCRKITSGYRDVKVTDMSTSWRDGLAFCAILHHFRPDLIDFDSLSKENIFHNNNLAFSVAEQQLGIAALLDAEDMVTYKVPDRLSILTYVSQLYQHFHTMEAPVRKGPTKRTLNEDKTDTLAESPGKRSAVNVTSVAQSAQPSPASATPVLSRNHEVCHACRNRVYILERLIVENKLFHRTCLKCAKCQTVLSLGSYVESDKPDQYECIQCPAAKAPVAKMTSESRPPLYVASPPSVATDHQEAVLRERTSGESVTVRRSLFPSRPDAGVSLEIALAAAKARSHFHSRWLNEDNSTSEAPPPVVDTGQAKKHSHPTDACDTSRNSGRVKAVERLQEVPVKQEKVPSSKPPPLPTSDPPKKIVNDVSSKPTIDEPCKVSSEQPPKESVDGPSKVSSEQPSKAFADGPSKVSSEQPSKASSNEPSKVSSEQPSKASADGPLKVPSEQPPKVSVDGPSKDPTIASSKAAPEVTLPLTSIDDQSVNRRANDRPSLPTKPSHFPERPHSLALRSSFQPQATVKIRQTETVVVPEEVGRRPSSLPVVDVNQPKLPQENVDVTVSEDKRAAPVAAPRISRTKRQSKIPQQVPSEDQKPQQSLDGASKPFEVCVEQDDTGHGGRMPVPLKRTSLNSSSTELAAAAAPPKPPRRAVLPEPENEASSANRELEVQGGTVSQTPSAKTVDYPVDLNPFGDDDDKGTVKGLHAAVISSPAVPEVHVVKEKKSLNPFGDSDDELSDNDERLPKQQALPQRRLIPCDWYNKNLNPFSSDSDEEDEGSGHLKTPPEFPGDVEMNKEVPLSEKVEGRSVPRKKRAAPKPPSSGGPKATSESGFATPSPKLTPSGSPKSSGKSRAPKPPSPHPSHSRRHSSSPVSMRHTLSAQEAAQRISNWSDTSSSGVFQTPDSEGSRLSSVSGGSSVNTFGAWKKKKRRAPPLPIPQKRQLQKIPLKEIEVELQEIEEKQLDLEKEGVEIEITIREKFDDVADPTPEEEDLVLQLFELVNKKNALFRRQTELVYLKRQQRLEEEHAELEYQIRCLMSKPEHKKTEEDRAEEEQLISRLVNVVTLRSEIVESMEMDRLREAQEDRSIHERLTLHQRSSSLGSLSLLGNTLKPGGSGSSKGSPPSSFSIKGKVKKDKKKKNKQANGDRADTVSETQSLSRGLNELEKKRRWF